MGETEVELPVKVQRMIEMICYEQCQPPPDASARKILASIGQDNSIHMLNVISQKRITTSFSGFIKHMLNDYIPKPTTPTFVSPLKLPLSSPPGTDGLSFHSPSPKHLLHSPSSNSDKKHALVAVGSSSCTKVQTTGIPEPAHYLLASPGSGSGNSYTPTQKRLKFSPHVNKIRGNTSRVSKQWQILSELEFRRIFLVLNYIGRKKLEDVVSEEDAYKILQMKGYPMEIFESQLWTMYGRYSFVGTESTNRRKFLDWECGETHHYHCHVWRDGSFSFKGPYLKTTKTLLHRTLGDENILVVKFEEQARGGSTIISGDHDAFYGKVAKEGILIGQRCYRFFVFKDGERKGKKNSPIASNVKCYFIRMELVGPCNVKDPFNLVNKTMHEARCLFMHLHTTPSMAKYASRCSLVLSQTIKVEVNFDTVKIERIEDIPCQNENGISVCNEDGDLFIHTDGTGFISEDLAMKCPRALLSARYRKDKKSEMEDGSLEGKLTDGYVTEPPLLMQCRLFNKGLAVKGTFLVNRKLPPGTIQIRPSMVKVEAADPSLKDTVSVNSLEVVNISRKPGKSRLSKYLIALLYFGGVPEQFFMKILADALEDTQRLFSDKRSAVRASVNHGAIDDDYSTARIILSGVPMDEPCVQHRLSHLAYSERKGLREGRLPISESYFLMGTADPTGLLKSNEVCVILDNGQISGKVLVYRYPGLHFGDIHVLNAVYLKELEDIVGNAKYGIFFSTEGQRSVASEIANGDFDGDMYWVSKNNQLLHYFKESTPWIRMHSSPKKIHRKPSDFPCEELEHELFKLFLNTKNQNVSMGVAADSWMAFTDKFLTLDDNSNEKNNLKKKMLKLIDIYYDALDAPKTGKEVTVPKPYRADLYPHYMGKGDGYHSSSILGKICDAVDTYKSERTSTEIRKLPLFELVQIPDAKLKFWEENYDNYRQEMSAALSPKNQSEMNSAGKVINKYKQILYGAADFERRSRNIDDIHVDAIALYHVCYDFAKIKGDVSKCNFAWRIAGPALCNFHVLNSSETDMFYCLPSVLGEILN